MHTDNTLACDDGDLCTQTDTCSAGVCAGTPVDCGAQQCDPADGLCKDCLIDADCDNVDVCTDDACVAGTCQNTNNTASCDDGDACTIQDTCTDGTCIGTPISTLDCTDPDTENPFPPVVDLCGSGLCGIGAASMMPFMVIALSLLKMRRRAYGQ